MLFSRPKNASSICPTTGKPIERKDKFRWVRWLFPITGLFALIWFLIRVIPKPSRAAYPCQRVAFPLASSFIIWMMGLAGSVIAYRKAKRSLLQARYVLAAVCLAVSIGFVWAASNSTDEKITYGAEDPRPANDPIGIAKGVNPGRVAWIHDANATNWNGGHPPYWYDGIDQQVVSEMLSKSLKILTGKNNDADAWDAIFRNYNQQHGRGNVGYTAGEKIAIKMNWVLMINKTNGDKTSYLDNIDNSPQLAIALLRQLTDAAGVSPGDISIGDPQNCMANYWYNMVEPNCPGVVYLTKQGYSLSGRTQVAPDYNAPLYWSDPCDAHWSGVTNQDYIPAHFSQSTYFINFPVLKSHNSAGITLSGKNHYGSLMRAPNATGYYNMHNTRPANLDSSPYSQPGMGYYRANVDLMSHPKMGGKTMLVLIDGLYGGQSWNSIPIRYLMSPFNHDWPSSIFLSQDQVAADSVAYDFLYTELDGSHTPTYDPNPEYNYPHYSGTHDYLHEAALIPDPPSDANYDPNHDGGLTESLGVHEHWNNAIDKQYSRNLDPINGNGIELMTEPERLGDFDNNGRVDFKDFAILAATWFTEFGDTDWNADCDISMPSDGVIDELDLKVFCDNWLN